MGDINKRYVIEVGADKKSLEQLKQDLNNAIKEPFKNMGKDNQVKGLSRSDKAAIKADLASLFGIADEQAEALRKMVQGIIPSDTKGISQMKTQLQDTLKFATGIMEQMQKISDSTDWMKQGVSFVDKFVGLQGTLTSTQKVVADIQTSVDALAQSFKAFQDALAVTNPDAFAKRFGKGAKSGVQIDANIKAIAKEMTDAAARASKKIEDVIADLEDEGIKIAVTLPDPNDAEFATQINNFVKKASDQFEKNPIKLNVELLDPFKSGSKAKMPKHQKKLADQAKEVAKSAGFSDESLIGLDSPDTSRTVRHILDSFLNIKRAIKEGQDNITDETKKWRQKINEELTLKAKFDNLDIKSEVGKLMKDLQDYLDSNPPLYIDIDVDSLIDEIQEALKETTFNLNIKADNIDGKGTTLNLGGTKLSSGGKIEVAHNDPQATRPPQSERPTIDATKKNSEAVSESTRAQTVLADAIKDLQSSIDHNAERNERSEAENTQRRATAERNAAKIAELHKTKDDLRADGSASNKRNDFKQQLASVEEERDAALKHIAGRVTSVEKAFKDGDLDIIENEFNQAIQFLQAEKEQLAQSIENIKTNANIKNKQNKIANVKTLISNLDKLLGQDVDQEKVIIEALKMQREKTRDDFADRIDNIQKNIQHQDRVIINTNSRISNIISEIDELSQETNIAATEKTIQRRASQSKKLQKRQGNIQSILDSNQSPVQLVFDEVQEFWKKSYRTIEKTKAELDDLNNGKYSDDLKAKLSKLAEEEQKTMVQGLIASKEKRITDWQTRQTLMSQKGLGNWSQGAKLEDVLKSFTIESLTEVLRQSSTLSDGLLKNSKLKDLSSIQDIAYYSGVAQDALGFRTQTEGEYVDEKTLQAKLMELARIKAFTEKVNGMFPRNNGTPELQGIEGFIEFFEKLNVTKDTIATIVAQAKDKIGTIQEGLIGKSEDSAEYQNRQLDINRLQSIIDAPASIVDAAKDYLESFKNFANTIANDSRFAPGEDGKVLTTSQIAQVIWDGMDSAVRDSVTKAMLSSSEFSGVAELNQVSIAGVLDKMTKVFETGALKDISSEDKSYQQLVALLDRQSKFQRAKTVTDLQYSGSVKSSLYDARTPDKPIYVKVVGSHGEETVYDIHKPGKGRADSDKSFSTNSKGLERLFKHLGIEDQVGEIVSAMFNNPDLAQTLIDELFVGKNISLSTKPFTRTASKEYGFANTPLGKYLGNKDQISTLQQEIAGLQAGEYTDFINQNIQRLLESKLNALKEQGLSEDAINQQLREYEATVTQSSVRDKLIDQKQKQLNTLLQLQPTLEQVLQSLIVLADDIAIDKAKLKDTRRSKRRNTRRSENLTEDGTGGWAHTNRIEAEKRQAQSVASQIRSGTKGTSQRLANPLQQLIDSVGVAREYGLMDTAQLDELIAKYQEAYTIARDMPRIKDAGTPVEMFDEINAAWKAEEDLRGQLIDLFYNSDGAFGTQLVKDRIDTIRAEAERAKQAVRDDAGANNGPIDAKLASIEAEKAKLEQEADELEAALQEKYIRNAYRDVAIATEQNERAISEKAKEINVKKLDLYNIADNNAELKAEASRLGELQDAELAPLRDSLRKLDRSDTEGFKKITTQMDAIKKKYTEQYRLAKQAWIDTQSAQLDAELKAFTDSIQNTAVTDAESRAVSTFNADMAGKGIHVNSMEEVKSAIQKMVLDMYQAAANQAEQAKASVDQSGLIPQEEINAKIAEIEEDAKKKVAEVIASVVGKSDAALMANNSYGKMAESAAKDVDDLNKAIKDKEDLLNDLLAQFGLTREALHAETRMLETSGQTAKQMQSQMSDNGSGSGGIGYSGIINTSNLAQESTLRGIYELLNGAPPAGGWGDDEKKSDISDDDFSDGTISSMSALASSIKDMVADCKNYSVEVGYLVDRFGKVGETIQGKAHSVPRDAFIAEVNKHTSKDILASLHSHPGKTSKHLSPADIYSSYNRAYFDENKIPIAGSINDGVVSAIDWREIDVNIASQIVERYKSLINDWQSTMPDIFKYNEKTKKYDADGDKIMADVELQKAISQKYNEILQQTLNEFGYSDRYMQFDDAEKFASHILGEAASKVTNIVIEAGAQAAVESSKKIAKEDIKKQQVALQEKFKTKDAETGKTKDSVAGASKIDQALYNVGDRLTKESLTDADLGKLTKAYSQLENAFKEEIVSHLDQETVDFLNVLRGQISSVLDANASRLSEKDQQSKAVADAKKYLSELRTEEGKRVSGTSRANTGIDQIYSILDKDKEKLSNKDLTTVAQGYYRLQQTVNHAVFEKLDENTKKVINDAIQEAKTILDKYGVTVQGDELIGTVLDDANAKLFANANKKDKKKKVGRTISSVAEPQIMKGDTVLSKASVYLDGTTKQQAQEIATAEAAITQEKKEQAKLTAEAMQNEQKQTTVAQERAQAEKQATESKKQTKVAPQVSSGSGGGTSGGGNQGGFLGALNRIAQEETLKSIAALLSKGVKTTSGGKQSGGGKSKVKKAEESTSITGSEAYAMIARYVGAKYPNIDLNPNKVRPTMMGYSADVSLPKNRDLQETKDLQARINQYIADGAANTQECIDAQNRLNALLKEQETITISIGWNGKNITEKSTLNNLAIGAKAAIKELQTVDAIMERLHEHSAISIGADGNVSSGNASIVNYLNSLDELQKYKNELSSKDLFDPSVQQKLSTLTLHTQNYRKEVVALLNAIDQYNTGDSKGILTGIVSDDDSSIKKAMQDAISANSEMITSFGNLTPVRKNGQVASYQLAYTLQTGKREVQEMTASLNPLTHELTIQKGAVKAVATGWDKFVSGLKGKFSSIIQYLVSITSIHDIIRYVRQGVQYVREIDSALTELKKVTDETDASYNRFLQDMAKTGSVIGATVKDLTTMAAEWARLGYSMEEAGKLAESTAILLNVSEFQDATQASEALISTMQAFGYAADESQHVVDVLNEVGNNYAVSSDGIATALQDSASALMEGGNNLEQAVALVAAANRVVQDPSSVGSALRTISLRLRGTSVEVLQELGEETDNVVESTSKLQEKIKALSGVDILTDAGAYKDTYTILKEIGTVWEDMSDIDQAECCLYVQKCA